MSVFLQPIYTQTASGSASGITFNNIPQTFTDLLVVVSARSTYAVVGQGCGFSFYNSGGFISTSGTKIEGNGSSAYSQRYGTVTIPGSSATANTFGSISCYLPNYTGSNYKQAVIDGVSENNGSESYTDITAQLIPSTTAITAINFSTFNNNLAQYSTVSLYGVLRQGI